MEKDRIATLNGKARGSKIVGVLGIAISLIGFILGNGYSNEAARELESVRLSNPEYQAMLRKREELSAASKEKEREYEQQRYLANQAVKQKELEAQSQRYALEQEKLKVDQENERLSGIQAMNTDAMATLDKYVDPDDLDDYGLIDAAYEILDVLRQDGITEHVKYRGLKRLSEFKNYTEKRSTDEKLDSIIAKAERL